MNINELHHLINAPLLFCSRTQKSNSINEFHKTKYFSCKNASIVFLLTPSFICITSESLVGAFPREKQHRSSLLIPCGCDMRSWKAGQLNDLQGSWFLALL